MLKAHHTGNGHDAFAEVAYTVMDSVPEEEDELPEDYAPTIVAESTKKLRTMSVASAVMALDMTDDPVLSFRSAGSNNSISSTDATTEILAGSTRPISKAE